VHGNEYDDDDDDGRWLMSLKKNTPIIESDVDCMPSLKVYTKCILILLIRAPVLYFIFFVVVENCMFLFFCFLSRTCRWAST